MDFGDLLQVKYIIAALVYSGLGIAVLAISFLVLDLLTPKVSLWRELVEKQNVAFGIFLGSLALGLSIIIASAIHG